MPYVGAEIWGGALWDIRAKLGREVADPIVASAWLGMTWPCGRVGQGIGVRQGLAIGRARRGSDAFPDDPGHIACARVPGSRMRVAARSTCASDLRFADP